MERICSLAIMASAAIMLAGLAWPLALGKVFQQDDLAYFHLPVRAFYAHCLANGDDFRWFPNLYCGFDLHGEGQAGMDHPLHRLLYGWLPLETAFQLEIWLNYPALIAGTAFLFARWGLRRDACLLGASVFTFSGFNILHYVHMNAMAVVAHVPWLLLAIDVVLRSDSTRHVGWAKLAVGVLTGSQLLLGYPQYVGFSLLIEVCYAVGLGFSGQIPGVGRWLGLLEAKGLGLLLGCDQLLPTWDALKASVRSQPGADIHASNSLHPINLAQSVAPYAFKFAHYRPEGHPTWPMHEYAFYAGSIVPALLAWLVVRRTRLGRWRVVVVATLMLAVAGLMLALGTHTPVFPLVARLPLVGIFRAPARFVWVVHAAVAAMVAVAYHDLAVASESRSSIRPRWALWPLAVPALASLAAGGLLALARAASLAPNLSDQLSPLRGVLTGPILIGLPALAAFLVARGYRWGLPALVVLLAADQTQYGLDMIVRRDPPMSVAELQESRIGVPKSTLASGVSDDGVRIKTDGDQLALRGLRLVDGYVGLHPRRNLDYTRQNTLRVAGALWAQGTGASPGWRRLEDPLPRARLVARAIASRAPREDIERIDVAREVLVESAIALPRGPAGSARVISDRPGRIKVRVEAPAQRVLVVNESYHRGWRMTDGRAELPVLRVNGDFLGCVVNPGTHDLELRFDPPSHRLGARLSLLGGLLAAASLVASQVSGRRGRSRTSDPQISARPRVLRARAVEASRSARA
jgi:hypothetical protein